MLNVCNLEPIHFARILSGAKRTEWRWRRSPDSRLEAVTAGEPIALLECGSDRVIHATVRHAMRFDFPDGHLYAVRIREPHLDRAAVRKIQGWHRRSEL